MRIGLFGGSFNPIHNGHITLGTTMLRAMCLDNVWYMVSPHNPLKQAGDLLGEQERLRMVQMAVEEHPGLVASDYEFHLTRPSYTWNTLQSLHRDYPNDEFVLIIGGDNWACFDRWAHHDDIIATHEVAIFPREDSLIDATTLPHGVHLVNVPLVNVTSTQLRNMLRKGEDVSQFVPEKVAQEIEMQGYYR